IDICRTYCACSIGAKCSSWLTARAHSRTRERRARISSESKTIGSVTTAMSQGCSIRKSGRNSAHASKGCATGFRATRELDRQFRESARESLELDLFSSEPIYEDYEILRLGDSLTDFASRFAADDPMVQKILAGKSPHARAVELVTGTKLKDVGVRKDLYGKDAAALQVAHEPMLDLARLIDAPARAARKVYDTQDEIKKQAYSDITRARFSVEGA